MPRKQLVFDDIVDLVSRLPWWAGLLLAGVAYFGLHALAGVEIPHAPAKPGELGTIIVAQILHMLAFYGQYLLPAAFTLGALVSVLRRRQRTNLYRDVARAPSQQALEGISWREFEQLVGEWFRTQGYAVLETGGVGEADGGVDLVLSKDGETYLVQCKQWKAFKVGVNVVRELLGVMAMRRAAGAFLVTSGVFTEEARRFAAQANITLVNGRQLSDLLRQRPKVSATPPTVDRVSSPPQTAPRCPKCGAGMVLRTASKGTNAGHSFWGCSRFPACRQTRPV